MKTLERLMDYKKGHFSILIEHLLRSRVLLELALNQLEPQHIIKCGGGQFHAIAFVVIRDHFNKYQTIPDKAIVRTGLDTYLDTYVKEDIIRASILVDFDEFIKLSAFVDEKSEGLCRNLIAHIADVCLFQPSMKEALTTAIDSSSVKGLKEKLQELETKQQSIAGGISYNKIVTGAFAGVGDRYSFFIPWLDAKFGKGRGPVRGSGMAIIGPQGGGKTTLGVQIVVQQALNGKHAMLVLTEEAAETSVSVRRKIISCALGVPYQMFEDVNPSNIDPKTVHAAAKAVGMTAEMVDKKLELLDTYLHIIDWAETPTDVDAIFGELQTLKSRNMEVTFTYIDWAGPIADRMMAMQPQLYKAKEGALKKLCNEACLCAARTSSIVILSQQLRGDLAQRGTFVKLDMYCAADCKGFTQNMKYAFGLGSIDPKSKNSILTVLKARDDAPMGDRYVIRLQGEVARIEDVSSAFTIKAKRFEPKLNKQPVPKERT